MPILFVFWIILVISSSLISESDRKGLLLGIAIFSINLMVRRGLGGTLGAWSIALAAMTFAVAALAQNDADSTIVYVIASTVIRAAGLAGILAGSITGSIIVSMVLAISKIKKSITYP